MVLIDRSRKSMSLVDAISPSNDGKLKILKIPGIYDACLSKQALTHFLFYDIL